MKSIVGNSNIFFINNSVIIFVYNFSFDKFVIIIFVFSYIFNAAAISYKFAMLTLVPRR